MRRILMLLGLAVALPAGAEVFVNELHYDNAGTDAGEAVEVLATAGEDLSQYSLVLYNGSGGVRYDTDVLPAGSAVSCGSEVRVAVLSYPANGIQNGNPDGLALVGPGDAVIQFLSYGGAFTATDGPAAGLTSTNLPVAESSATLAGQSLQLGGTGAAYADFTWNAPASDTFGDCNTGQSFTLGPPVNVAPSVQSSVPAAGGSVTPGTQAFSVTFSETVTAQASAFAMSCSQAGTVPLSLAANNARTMALSTTAVLANGDSCTLRVLAAGITDSEGLRPVQDEAIAFAVAAAPNVRPSVVSSTPARNAAGVAPATDLRIVFSEMVSADSGSFVLQCSESGLFPSLFMYKVLETTAEGGRAITLSPRTLLAEGETCTLTVLAGRVTDRDNEAMAADHVVVFTIAGPVGEYYRQVNTSSPDQLRCSLHATIRGHTVYPYTAATTDTWDILNIADEDPANPANILDVYRNASYTKIAGGTGAYNREHTWPKSLGFSSETGNLGLPNAPHTDTHMLHASDTGYNSERSNSPYGNCPPANGCAELVTQVNNGAGGGSGVYPGNSNWVGGDTFQTWNGRKGNVARAVLYMAIRYEGGTHPATGQNEPDLELTDNRALIVATSSSPAYMGFLGTLLEWHQADPPDAQERERNEVIFSFQGNRNPFIDHPEWATPALFTSSQPQDCQLANQAAARSAPERMPQPAWSSNRPGGQQGSGPSPARQ